MPRFIRIDRGVELKVTHSACGAIIGYYQSEVKYDTRIDFTGDSEKWYYIICPNPNCNKKIEVKGNI